MTAPNKSTFDLGTPRRPTSNDFNGIAKVDDLFEQPDPTTMPNAAEWNTVEYLILSIGRVMPVAVLTVANTGTPTLSSFLTAPTAPNNGTFTITHTATGNVLIAWPALTFPSSACAPVACLNAGPGMIHCVVEGNGIRVHTYNAAGAAADFGFTVTVY